MNIFILDKDPQVCAEYMMDKHVVKMILEHTQMLSTTCKLAGLPTRYKLAHKNHPCTIWCRESLSNWHYLRDLTVHIHREWQYRYGKSCNHLAYTTMLELDEPNIPDKGLTPFAIAIPPCYQTPVIHTDWFDSTIHAYRYYYCTGKSHLARWHRRNVPTWYTELSILLKEEATRVRQEQGTVLQQVTRCWQ